MEIRIGRNDYGFYLKFVNEDGMVTKSHSKLTFEKFCSLLRDYRKDLR
jgi:hypothetical protein